MGNVNNFRIEDGVLVRYCGGELVIPDGVTRIDDYAFDGCTDFTDVIISNGVLEIGSDAFRKCTNLKGIEIPSSVREIGDEAFLDCTKLVRIEIPDSVTRIGVSTFSGCSNLLRVVIPSSAKSIGDGAFSDCTSLEKIEIPSGVTSIGKYAFSGCTSLTSIKIPDSVTEIGDKAFKHCNNLVISAPEGSYAAEYAKEHFGRSVDLDALLADLGDHPAEDVESVRIAFERNSRGGMGYCHLILKEKYGEIHFVGKCGWNDFCDEDLNRAEYEGEYFGSERSCKLYALLVKELRSSDEDDGASREAYAAIRYVGEENCKKAVITPTMMAIFNEFVNGIKCDSQIIVDAYNKICDSANAVNISK